MAAAWLGQSWKSGSPWSPTAPLLSPHRVPNEILGRVSAFELAIYYFCECASGILSGVAFDFWQLEPSTACVGISMLAVVPTSLWCAYASAMRKHYESRIWDRAPGLDLHAYPDKDGANHDLVELLATQQR